MENLNSAQKDLPLPPSLSPPPTLPQSVHTSEEIVQHLSPHLLHLNYHNLTTKLQVVSAVFSFFLLVFLVSLSLVLFIPIFKQLKLKDKVSACLCITRGMFGISCIVLGGHAMTSTTNIHRDVVFGRSATSSFTMLFTTGFFSFELASSLISDLYFRTFSKLLTIHHLLGMVGYGLAELYYEKFHMIGVIGVLLEMSTPFTGVSFFLEKCGMGKSALWKLNQLLLIHTFHLRSVVEFYIWYLYLHNFQHVNQHMPSVLLGVFLMYLSLLSFVMTPYWGYRKTKQLFVSGKPHVDDVNMTETLVHGEVKKVL